MPRRALGVAAATAEIALGLPAVVMLAAAIVYLINSGDVDKNRGTLVLAAVLLGSTLFAIWWAARTKRRWLIVLTVCSGVLFAVMTIIATVLYRPSRFDDLHGLWSAPAAAGVDVLLWLLIMVISLLELRLRRAQVPEMARWIYLPSIVAPLAVITALAIMVGVALPGWLVRLNSVVGDVTKSPPGQASTLSGAIRWTHDIDSYDAVATADGVAVAVAADGSHSGGVIMIDAGTGRQLWRYQLHGTAGAPDIAATDNGHGIVVDIRQEPDLPSQITADTYVIDAATGRVRGVWPEVGEVAGTEPPVIFNHVAQGANSVIALSSTGRRLWTYRPQSCADPRSVSSTPEVMVVIARTCGGDDSKLNVVGLDARTGDVRWTQSAAQGMSEDGPDQTLPRLGFEIEATGSDTGTGQSSTTIARRDLTTGRIDWQTSAGGACDGKPLTAGGGTVFMSICRGAKYLQPNEIAGYAMRSGDEVLRHKLDGSLEDLAAVDDHTVLAAVGQGKICRLERIGVQPDGRPTTSTVITLPSAAGPGSPVASCGGLAILQVGRDWVLQLQTRDAAGRLNSNNRFIGLT